MGKRRVDPGQIAFAFEAPAMPCAGALAGDDVRVAMIVAEILHADPRPRETIAAEMSRLLGADVTKSMLDAYASPSREGWTISYSRMKALISVTSRHDLLDRDLRGIGASLLIGDEIYTARLGHLRAQMALIQQEIRAAERNVQPIFRGSVKPEAIKTWFTAQEIADMRLSGLPTVKRKVNERAAEERWALATDNVGAPLARPRMGRGGGLEYHFSLLPIGARAALAKRGFALAEVERQTPEHVHAWRNYDRLTGKAKAEAERRAAAIMQMESLEDLGLTRTAAIAAVAASIGTSTTTLWNWLAMVEGVAPFDRLPFLAPTRAGGGKAAEIDPQLWQIFLSDYLRAEQPTVSHSYREAIAFARANDLPIPQERTLRRKLERDVDPRVVIARRKGMDAVRKTIPAQRRSVSHLHALELVNIDGHKFDVWVTMPGAAKPVRPIIVGIQDVYSKKLLAWRIGETESAHLTRLAFADLFRDYGIPRACYLDNGRAFASKWITGGALNRFRFTIREDEPTGLLTSLGIGIHWTKPYRGQSKPIERAWRDIANDISRSADCAGAFTGNNALNKPENYGSRAIPFEDFKAIVERRIAEHNARPGRTGETAAGGSFDDAFAASYRVSAIPKATEEHLRLALLTGEQVKVNRDNGMITLAGNQYWAEGLHRLCGKKVIIRFDPEALHQPLHVYTNAGLYFGEAGLIAASEFDNLEAAKERAKIEARLRKSVREQIDVQNLLTASQVAARASGPVAVPDLPDAGAVRPVRHRGQTAAALKPVSQAAQAPVSNNFLDDFVAAERRLRLVE